MPRPRASLRTRLAVLFTLGSAAVLLGAAVFLFVIMDRALLGEVDQGLSARGRDLGEVVRASGGEIPDQDPFAQVIGSDGRVIDSSPGAGTAEVAVAGTDLATPTERYVNADVAVLGGDARLLVKPVVADGQRLVLVVGSPLEQYVRTRERLLVMLLIGGPLLVVLSAAAGWALAGAALKPVRRMAEEANAISITDLDRRLEVPPGHDEIAELGQTLNDMLDRLESSFEHERRFIDDASHELRSPLAILRGELELALASPLETDEMAEAVRSALAEAERLSRIATDLLVLARARSGDLEIGATRIDVAEQVDRVIDLVDAAPGPRPVRLGGTALILGDRDRLDQVLINLLINAKRHATNEVRVIVVPPSPTDEVADRPDESPAGAGAEVVTDDADRRGRWIEVIVQDDGPGFAASMLPVTFERFVRADASRSRETGGTGLGLAITAELTKALDGRIDAGNGPVRVDAVGERTPLDGAWVRIRFPCLDAEPGPG